MQILFRNFTPPPPGVVSLFIQGPESYHPERFEGEGLQSKGPGLLTLLRVRRPLALSATNMTDDTCSKQRF